MFLARYTAEYRFWAPLVGILTLALMLLSTAAGWWVAERDKGSKDHPDSGPVILVAKPTVSLRALLMAVTFGMAGVRYETRRERVVEEANSIGTAYLRAGLCPAPHGQAIRDVLREYTDVCVDAIAK